MISIRTRIDAGVLSAGFNTTVFPAARAGASFHTAIRIGKFHGIICATTPIGSCTISDTVLLSSSLMDPSSARITPAKYRKWSMANGISALSVSRTAFPLSIVSTAAIYSKLASIRSAILLRIILRSVAEVFPQVSKALAAVLTARSRSSFVEWAT
ncbi:hypothetical protein D3C81_1697510 [compost metagenome]